MTRARNRKQPVEPGLIPAPGELLDWRDSQHFDRWQDQPARCASNPRRCASTPRNPSKACAESWIAANPVEARRGRFASDSQPKSRHENNHA
ncbi:hypothetical protein OG582_39505 (plasmid) [Streptomyces anulatus]|uniref:hypothetical protein n=1 Tax=Streptomyces anulatus TaxID=1892 RepID=UPI0032479713